MDKMAFRALADLSGPSMLTCTWGIPAFLGLRSVDTSYGSRDEAP